MPLRESTGKRAYELLKLYAEPHGLHVFDSLVAATAIEEGLTAGDQESEALWRHRGLEPGGSWVPIRRRSMLLGSAPL